MTIRSIASGVAALLFASLVWGAASAPHLINGHPDLNGVWENGGGIDFVKPVAGPKGSVCVTGCAPSGQKPSPRAVVVPDRPVYKPQFVARVQELAAKQVQFDPVLRCRPPGVPRIGPPDKIVQTAREVIFLYEDVSGPFFRVVPLDAKAKRNDDSESYQGEALGRWEGDTLVVETRNFNEETWLTDDGAIHSTELRVTERLRRTGDTIDYRAVVEDPVMLAQPWVMRPRTLTRTDVDFGEPAPCIEQDMQHMVDDSHHTNPR
jgi:hypothetical protein